MKKKLPWIIGLLGVIIFSVFYAFTDRSYVFYDNNLNTVTYSDLGILQEGDSLIQNFTCQQETLDGFFIKCEPAGDYKDVFFNYTLIDRDTDKVLYSSTCPVSDLRPRKLNKFPIDSLKNAKGKNLSLVLTETNSSKEGGARISYQKNSSIGDLKAYGQEYQGVLVFKTYTHGFNFEVFVVAALSLLFVWGFLWFLYRLFK